MHINDEWIIQLCKDLSLVYDWFYAALRDDARFAHFFKGITGMGLFTTGTPDFSEATLTDAVVEQEITLRHGWAHIGIFNNELAQMNHLRQYTTLKEA